MLRTNMRETSLDAHDYVQSSGKAATQEMLIINFMDDNRHLDFTRRELAKALDMETSTMSARVNSLVKAGKVIEMSRKRKCSISGITAIVLHLPPRQQELI
jgi:DNA-binding MarR family transcriptional regulator